MNNARPSFKTESSATVAGVPKSNRKVTPRKRRVLEALLNGAVWREQLDRIAGASNSPQLVSELRRMGLVIECDQRLKIDRDGRPCYPGIYLLRSCSVERVRALLEVTHE